MNKNLLLLILIGVLLLLALKLGRNQIRPDTSVSSTSKTELSEELPALAQNKVAVNPFVTQPQETEEEIKQDTKDFKEVSEEEASALKPYGKPQM